MVIIQEVEVYLDEDGIPTGYASVRYVKDANDTHSQWQSAVPASLVKLTQWGEEAEADYEDA